MSYFVGIWDKNWVPRVYGLTERGFWVYGQITVNSITSRLPAAAMHKEQENHNSICCFETIRFEVEVRIRPTLLR
jgi:hypothetical protein